jgi:predicted deacylase
MTVEKLLQKYSRLETDFGWERDLVFTQDKYPVYSYRTQKQGPALWAISGIHGIEKDGPNAMAIEIETIARMANICPTIIIPLCNPLGFVNGWRYTHPSEDGDLDGLSVGDPNTTEGKQLSIYLLKIAQFYPPRVHLDHHHDITLDGSYVYSHDKSGLEDLVAKMIITTMKSVTAIQINGATRWNEPIINGIVGPVADGSIDDFVTKPPISAKTSIVIETSSLAAHVAIIRAYPVIARAARL